MVDGNTPVDGDTPALDRLKQHCTTRN